MTKALTPVEAENNWFKELVDDCQGILVEGLFNYHWSLIQVYHSVGERIVQDEKKFGDKNPIPQVASALGRSERTIQRCVQFYKKYPDLNTLPEGKTYEEDGKVKYPSWHKIVNKYLPETVSEKQREAQLEVTIKAKELHDWAFKLWSIQRDLESGRYENAKQWLSDLEEAMRKPLEKTGYDPQGEGSD